jgi:hypothetical protein
MLMWTTLWKKTIDFLQRTRFSVSGKSLAWKCCKFFWLKTKWRRRKYEFSSSLFPVLLLFLKLAKLSKEKEWNNHTHGLELTWNLKWGRLAKLDKFGGAPFRWRRQWWEKCHATKNRAEGRCVYRWVRGGAKLSWTQLNHGWRSSHFILQYFFGWCIGGRWVMYSSAKL